MEDWEGESDCERAKEIECQLYAEIYHDRFGSLDDGINLIVECG